MKFKSGDRVRWYADRTYIGTVVRVDNSHTYVTWDHDPSGQICPNRHEYHVLADPMDDIDGFEVDA